MPRVNGDGTITIDSDAEREFGPDPNRLEIYLQRRQDDIRKFQVRIRLTDTGPENGSDKELAPDIDSLQFARKFNISIEDPKESYWSGLNDGKSFERLMRKVLEAKEGFENQEEVKRGKYIEEYLRRKRLEEIESIEQRITQLRQSVATYDQLLEDTALPAQRREDIVSLRELANERLRVELLKLEGVEQKGLGSYARQGDLTAERLIPEEKTAGRTKRDEVVRKRRDPMGSRKNLVYILHISDIHMEANTDEQKWMMQLKADLRQELRIRKLHYAVISGDFGTLSESKEYERVCKLIKGIAKSFKLDLRNIVMVPGNHDLNYALSTKAYRFVPKEKLQKSTDKAHYISAGKDGKRVRQKALYGKRFANYSQYLFEKIAHGANFPISEEKQFRVRVFEKDRLLFLELNSSFEVDHHFEDRARICADALSNAFKEIEKEKYESYLKIALFHHPVQGDGCIANPEIMQLLAVHGFQVVMHGHLHEADVGFYRYDEKRKIHMIGAGTFGALTKDMPAGIPLQYNVLVLDKGNRRITVETRKREKPDGAWSADARWGSKKNPKPRYAIKLRKTPRGSRGVRTE